MKKNLPNRRLPANPDLKQLKRQAKELLAASPADLALHDAQLMLARSYGFANWAKLKARVDGATVDRLVEAVRGGNLVLAKSMLKARSELATMNAGRLPVLHHAVLARQPEMVRLLMEHGASPQEGIYPHRDSTSALDVALERGYDDVVSVINGGEGKRRPAPSEVAAPGAGPLQIAVTGNRPDEVRQLLALGHDPDERVRIGNTDEIEFSWGMPLWHCAGSGQYEMAKLLLDAGADPNGRVYASGSPLFQAFSQGDVKMIELLRQYGGEPEATSAGLFRQIELARKMLAGEAAYRLDGVGGDTLAEQLLWGAACGGDPEIVRMALGRVDWPREDPRWFTILEQPLRVWHYGVQPEPWDRSTYPVCFQLVLDRCDANISGRFGLTMLHSVAGSRNHVTAEERVAFATLLLAAGARLDVRDGLLGKTPLEWALRKQRQELVELFGRQAAG